MVTAATQPLTEAGWKHALNGHGIRWTSPDGDAGVQFDPLTAQHPQNAATWTIRAGPGTDRPTWAITASPHIPSSLLTGLSETPTHQTCTRQGQPGREQKTHSPPVRRRLRRPPPAAPAAVHADHRPARGGHHNAGSPIGQTGDPAHDIQQPTATPVRTSKGSAHDRRHETQLATRLAINPPTPP
ncbi:DUF317 domain-containing protein [Streptomyces sp. NPDC088729]|uniref:DUF317 domain-containing protein n=1 Tax=unclassified Streptomyces TaxID=2593676 RepID=UPI0032165AAA